MSFKRKSATDQMRKIKDIGDPTEVIHESQSPAATPAPAAVAPVAEVVAPVVISTAVEQPADVEPEAPATPAAPIAPAPKSGLSNVKSERMTLRCQVNFDSIIAESAERYGLTASSFLALSTLYLSQQPEDTANAAQKLLREVEGWSESEGSSPVRQLRQSPRFVADILEQVAELPIFAGNKSQAVKAAAAWIAAMDRAESDKVMFRMRIFDAKNDYALTENARVKRR